MRKLLTLLVLVPCLAQAQPPPGYYNNAQGLTGQALRFALEDIIDGHTVVSNASMWGHYYNTDAKPNGFVWDMYSDVPGGTPAYDFTFGVDQCGNYGGEGDCYNREHTFPQSWFNDASPMKTDLFHVYPMDGWLNGVRGNDPYGEVDLPSFTSTNGSKKGPCVYPGYVGTVFEPIDAYKGDLARTYFYMMTRYASNVSGWSSPMLSTGDLKQWAVNMLLQWHTDDPVSSKEIARNNAVYAIQNNRNPFIDDPMWVTDIWSSTVEVAEIDNVGMYAWVVDDMLYMNADLMGSASVTLFDITGRNMVSFLVNGRSTELPELSSGTYIAVIHSSAGSRAIHFQK